MIPVMLVWWRRVLIATAAVSAALASFTFLRDLALHVGWPSWAAVLLPLSIDALAAASLTEYHLNRSRTGLVVSVAAVVGSGTGNALSHLYSVGMATPTPVPVILVGVVPAVTLWLVIDCFTPRRTNWPATSTGTASGGSSSVRSSATAGTSPTTRPTRTATSGARSAAPPTGRTATTGTRRRTTSTASTESWLTPTNTAHVLRVLENSWHNETLSSLVSLLRDSTTGKSVSKTTAQLIRDEARRRLQQGAAHAQQPVAAQSAGTASNGNGSHA